MPGKPSRRERRHGAKRKQSGPTPAPAVPSESIVRPPRPERKRAAPPTQREPPEAVGRGPRPPQAASPPSLGRSTSRPQSPPTLQALELEREQRKQREVTGDLRRIGITMGITLALLAIVGVVLRFT
ncbi:MAG: hypothetical protein HY685_05630 [Chloroflexi bacterium]|nr:hypothetical protein [Chloroflexota bacterium]